MFPSPSTMGRGSFLNPNSSIFEKLPLNLGLHCPWNYDLVLLDTLLSVDLSNGLRFICLVTPILLPLPTEVELSLLRYLSTGGVLSVITSILPFSWVVPGRGNPLTEELTVPRLRPKDCSTLTGSSYLSDFSSMGSSIPLRLSGMLMLFSWL